MNTIFDLLELLALADKATPGPWDLSSDKQRITQTKHFTRDVWEIPCTTEDVEYIAACSPETIREIVSELLVAREEIEQLKYLKQFRAE